MYEVEFPDGEIRPYAANVIADNIWAQVDPDGQRYVIFESIIDHHVDSSVAVTKENMYIFSTNGQRTMRRTTAGVKLLVLYKDGSEQSFPLKDLKESNPVECAEYAKARKIDTEPAFRWWVPYTLNKEGRIITLVKSRLKANSHKYGIEVPKDIAHAEELDAKNGNRQWQDAHDL